MDYLTWWNFPKKAWLIIIGELCVITSLSIWLYMTYLNDVYFQSYTNSLSPILVPAISVAFGISSASIAAYLYLGIKRIQIERDSGNPTKKRTSHTPRESREPHKEASPPPKNETIPQTVRSRLKPIAPSHSNSRTRLPSKEQENQTADSEPKKQP